MLFASRGSAAFWLLVRVYLGYAWVTAGWHKIRDAAWTGAQAGAAVTGFLQGALSKTAGDHPSVHGWYAWLIERVFLPNAATFSYLVAYGEVIVGITLMVGRLAGLSAFFGGMMNASHLLAGTISTNPILLILATWLVLAWRVAGYFGLDYRVLPAVGAPRTLATVRRASA